MTENKMPYAEWYKIHNRKSYQYDVIETIYDRHDCLLWTAYDETEEDENGFNPLILICQMGNKDKIIMTDTEDNRQYCMERIDKYLLED